MMTISPCNAVLIHLNLIQGIGPAVVAKLIAGFADLRELYKAAPHEIAQKSGLAPAVAQKIVEGLHDTSLLETELRLLEKNHFSYATIADAHYPALLREIHLPPTVLYYQGTLPLERSMALVGSRAADRYGKEMVSRLVPALVENGWTTISGGALGADSMVHEQTLKAGGRTVAILGSGLLCPYPARNRSLFSAMVEKGGALISSFPLMTTPQPGNFPARNRIIAGLSRGCVVIQAAHKSGALITARFALDQGRDIFACPGRANDSLSAGCNMLIKQGAKLVTEVNDILEEYGQAVVREQQQSPVSSLEETLIHHCKEPKSAEELAIVTSRELNEIYAAALNLQLEGKLDQNAAGLFEAI